MHRFRRPGQESTVLALSPRLLRSLVVIETDAAQDCLLQRRFDEAIERLLALAERGRRQRRDDYRMSFALLPLALALIEVDRVEAAHSMVLEALPALRPT